MTALLLICSLSCLLFFFKEEEPISKDGYANKMQKHDRFKKHFVKD